MFNKFLPQTQMFIILCWHMLYKNVCYLVVICNIFTSSFFTCSLIKLKWASICLLLSEWTRLFSNSIANLLLTRISVASSCCKLNSCSKFISQIVWHTHQDAATYFVSHVDKITIDCFFESHVTCECCIPHDNSCCIFSIIYISHQSLLEYPTNLNSFVSITHKIRPKC